MPVAYGGIDGASAVAANPYDYVPHIDGGGRENSANRGVDFDEHNNIVLRNFYISNAYTGVYTGDAGSDDSTIENIFCFDVGQVLDSNGWGIHVHSGTSSNFCERVKVENCTVLNASYAGIELKRANDCEVIDCRVYADDNTGKIPTDYYFLIAGGNINDFVGCYAERYKDGSANLSHKGHAFAITGLQSHGLSSYGNKFDDCHATNTKDVCLLRGANTSGNTYADCTSAVTVSEAGLGCIHISNGPHDNFFRRLYLNNSDVAVDVDITHQSSLGQPPWQERNFLVGSNMNAAEGNLFESCIFECKLGISFSDYYDEIDVYNHDGDPDTPSLTCPGGTMANGSDLDIVNISFVYCTFIGSDAPGVETTFFLAGREASGNKIVNCIITEFDKYAEFFKASVNKNNGNAMNKVRYFSQGDPVVKGFTLTYNSIYNPDENGDEVFPAVYDAFFYNNLYDEDPVMSGPGPTNTNLINAANPNPLPPHTFPYDFFGYTRTTNPDIGAIEVGN